MENLDNKETLNPKNDRKVNLFRAITSDELSAQYDTKKIILGLKRHLLLIGVCGFIFAMLGVYATYSMTKTYKAEAVLIYNDERNVSRDTPGRYPLIIPSLATSVDLIMLSKNFEMVKAILGLDLDPEDIMDMVSIPPAKMESKVRKIQVQNKNPYLAIDIANALAKVVVKNSQEFTRDQLKDALKSFRSKLANANDMMAKIDGEIEEFKKKHQYFESQSNYVFVLSELQSLKSQLAKMEIDYQSVLVEYENLKRHAQDIPDMVPINRDTRDSPYKIRIVTLETALAQARAKYTPENPKVKLIEEELNELMKKLRVSAGETSVDEFLEKNPIKEKIGLDLMHLQGKVRSAQKAKEELAKRVKMFEENLQTVPEQQLVLEKLLQSKQLTEEQVKFSKNSIESIQLLIDAPNGIIDLYALAKEAKPSNDRWWVNYLSAITLLIGLGVGVLIAAAVEVVDPYVRTRKEININYTIPFLSAIPEIRNISIGNGEKKSLFFIRDLAEKIDRLAPKTVTRTIVFTSSQDKEGKSFLTYYLSAFYESVGKKVLVLEFDESFNSLVSAPSYSLSSLMENGSALQGKENHIRISDSHASVIKLLKSNEFTDFWDKLKSNYDFIITEVPGVIQDSFVVNMSKFGDILLFVIGSNKTEKKWVDESLHILESFDIAPSGIILNRIDPVYIDDERSKNELRRIK